MIFTVYMYVYTHGFDKMLEMIWVPYLVSKVKDIKDRHVHVAIFFLNFNALNFGGSTEA